jgi:phytoene dehydrogenase-like protein
MRQLMRESLATLLNRLIKEGKIDEIPALRKIIPQGTEKVSPNKLPKRSKEPQQDVPLDFKVCIVGSGMAGLYSALILDHLGIPYDILEAASRPGGRILTHYFSTKPHDYYDIGAMRFPKIPPMKRTFDLFERTGVTLIDYKLSGPGTPKRYNGRTVFKDKDARAMDDDPFHLSESNGGPVPDKYIATASQILEEAWRPLKEAIKTGNPMAYAMFKRVDHLTVREYLRDKM